MFHHCSPLLHCPFSSSSCPVPFLPWFLFLCQAHKGAFVTPQAAIQAKKVSSLSQAAASGAGCTRGPSTGRQRRVQKELEDLAKAQSGRFHVFPGGHTDGTCIDFLKVLMPGLARTPYEGGVFQLFVEFPSDYPFSPPKLTIVTPIYHYAVSNNGKMCLEVLNSGWSPARTVLQVCHCIAV